MFAKDGYSNIFVALLIAALLAVIGYFLNHWSSYVFYIAALGLTAFILFFFRDPDRDIPNDNSLIVSPADGVVVYKKEVDEPFYIKGKATQISIFLSPLDVHVNRQPATGTLEYVKYNPGKYLMAWNHDASSMNERADFGVMHESGTKIFFRQITGFMARRIVYHVKEGDEVKAGKRFGMMKFGSRMDILLPPDVTIEVEKGDRTIGGETILAKLSDK